MTILRKCSTNTLRRKCGTNTLLIGCPEFVDCETSCLDTYQLDFDYSYSQTATGSPFDPCNVSDSCSGHVTLTVTRNLLDPCAWDGNYSASCGSGSLFFNPVNVVPNTVFGPGWVDFVVEYSGGGSAGPCPGGITFRMSQAAYAGPGECPDTLVIPDLIGFTSCGGPGQGCSFSLDITNVVVS